MDLSLSNSLDAPLAILFEDERLLVLNKPAGILVHPGPKTSMSETTLMKLARNYLGQWVYPVHRLDRGTSGVLVFAKSPEVAAEISPYFEKHQTRKSYLAVVRGWLPSPLLVDYPLKDLDRPEVLQEARTEFLPLAQLSLPFPIDRYPEARYSLILARPAHGRQHQIRRHLKHISFPIIGDRVYGKGNHNRLFAEELACQRLLLHQQSLALGGEITEPFHARLDAAFASIIQRFLDFTKESEKQALLSALLAGEKLPASSLL